MMLLVLLCLLYLVVADLDPNVRQEQDLGPFRHPPSPEPSHSEPSSSQPSSSQPSSPQPSVRPTPQPFEMPTQHPTMESRIAVQFNITQWLTR